MVRAEQIHRDNNQPPLWLAPFKEVTNPRNLIILIPVLISLIFGGMFSMGRQDAYEDQQRQQAASAKTTQSQDPPSAKTALPTIITPKSAPITPASGTSNPTSNISSPPISPSSQTSSKSPVAIPPSLVQTLKPGLAPVCDTAAKTLAYATEQTALTAEGTYHTSQMVLALLSGNQDAENARHDAAVAQIKNTYSDSLELARCLY